MCEIRRLCETRDVPWRLSGLAAPARVRKREGMDNDGSRALACGVDVKRGAEQSRLIERAQSYRASRGRAGGPCRVGLRFFVTVRWMLR